MSSSSVFCVLLVTLTVVLAASGVDNKPVRTLPGNCPDFKPVASLDGTKFTGEWYQTHSLKKGIEQQQETSIKCVKYTNSIQPDGSAQSVATFTKNGKPVTKTISGTKIDGLNTKQSIKTEGSDDKKTPRTLTIIAAEPNSFYVTVLCASDGTNHDYIVQVLSHEKTLADADLAKVKEAMIGVNITDDLKATEGC